MLVIDIKIIWIAMISIVVIFIKVKVLQQTVF